MTGLGEGESMEGRSTEERNGGTFIVNKVIFFSLLHRFPSIDRAGDILKTPAQD